MRIIVFLTKVVYKGSSRKRMGRRPTGDQYGYLWWIIDGDSYAALGDGGNVIYINPAKNLVVAIASLFNPVAKDRIELIKKYIEPIIED